MPVAINMPHSQTEPARDPLEKLATAVNIARTGFGIYADTQALDAAKQKRAQEQEDRTAAQQQAALADDPASPLSQAARTAMGANGVNIPDNISASQIGPLYGSAMDLSGKQANTGKTKAETSKLYADIADKKKGPQVDPKRFTDLAKTVGDPTSRASLGAVNQQVNGAENIKTLADALGMPRGQRADPNETDEQRVQRYNSADSRQITEIVRSLDRQLSQSAPTESGQEHLTPTTFEGLAKKFGEKVVGSPQGMNQGQFIDRMMDTVDREYQNNLGRKANIINTVKLGYPDLVGTPQFQAILDGANKSAYSKPDAAAPPPQAKFSSDVLKYATDHGITPEQANNVKLQRTSNIGAR